MKTKEAIFIALIISILTIEVAYLFKLLFTF